MKPEETNQNAATESLQVRPESLDPFNPLSHQTKWKAKTMTS